MLFTNITLYTCQDAFIKIFLRNASTALFCTTVANSRPLIPCEIGDHKARWSGEGRDPKFAEEGGRDGSSQRERERERERQTMHFNAPAHMRAYHLRKETIRNAFAKVLEKEAMQIYTQNT